MLGQIIEKLLSTSEAATLFEYRNCFTFHMFTEMARYTRCEITIETVPTASVLGWAPSVPSGCRPGTGRPSHVRKASYQG